MSRYAFVANRARAETLSSRQLRRRLANQPALVLDRDATGVEEGMQRGSRVEWSGQLEQSHRAGVCAYHGARKMSKSRAGRMSMRLSQRPNRLRGSKRTASRCG